MIKVTIMYPNGEGSTFDMEYYLHRHMIMTKELLSPALRGVEVDAGISGGLPGSPAPYHAICHLLFDSAEAFYTAFTPHAQKIMGDIPNYTNTSAVVQISEVK